MGVKYKIVFLILFSFFSISYSTRYGVNKKKYTYKEIKKIKKFDQSKKLHSEIVLDEYKTNRISDFNIINDYLVLIDEKDDNAIKIFSLKKHKKLSSFGAKGQGPSEFIGAWQILSCPNNNEMFWVYDVMTRKLKKFSIRKVLNGQTNYPEKIVQLSVTKGFGFPFWIKIIPENKIVGTGNFYKGRISIIDMNGKYLRSIGKIPVDDEKFSTQHSQGFIGHFFYNSLRKEFYIATQFGTIIENYNLSGKTLNIFIGPDIFFPNYIITKIRQYYTMATTNKTRYGYIDINGDEIQNKIYLLYSGETEETDPYADYGNIVYVLGKNKKIIEKYLLDKKINQFKIQKGTSFIYGVTVDNEIVRFRKQ